MIEWWQALLLALIPSSFAGVFAWMIAYSQSRWSLSAAEEAAALSAAERLDQEIRQATRDHRRQRVQPFYTFIQVAREELTAVDTMKNLEQAYEMNLLGVQRNYTKEQFMNDLLEGHSGPSLKDLSGSMRGVMSATSDPRLITPFRYALASLKQGVEPIHPYKAMQLLEDALQDYIVNG